MKTIKIKDETYKWLVSVSGTFQQELGEPVSLDKTLNLIKENYVKKPKLSDLAGTWKMSDKEAKMIKKKIAEGWKRWRISV